MILLDTSVLIWTLSQSSRIGPQARSRLENATAVYFSAISIAELAIKSMLGKIDVPEDITQRILDQGLLELPATAEHAAAIRDFAELARHDPFDRLLLAQAYCAGLDLLTADRVLLGIGRKFVIDATN
jgi:PIN domain nuclease of toxin-antitoxin system